MKTEIENNSHREYITLDWIVVIIEGCNDKQAKIMIDKHYNQIDLLRELRKIPYIQLSDNKRELLLFIKHSDLYTDSGKDIYETVSTIHTVLSVIESARL